MTGRHHKRARHRKQPRGLAGPTALVAATGVALAAVAIALAGCADAPARPIPAQRPHVTALPALPPLMAPAPPAAPADHFGDGIYEVLVDIMPGTYRSTGPAPGTKPSCYWARLKDLQGQVTSLLASDYGAGPNVVTIAPSDKGFETRGCGEWWKR